MVAAAKNSKDFHFQMVHFIQISVPLKEPRSFYDSWFESALFSYLYQHCLFFEKIIATVSAIIETPLTATYQRQL
jgi:hypothetical protein